MLSLGFTLLLINGFLFVAYLKIICYSEMPYNIIPQIIRAVFNYKLERTLEVGKIQESCGRILMPIYLWFISCSHFFLRRTPHVCFGYWWSFQILIWWFSIFFLLFGGNLLTLFTKSPDGNHSHSCTSNEQQTVCPDHPDLNKRLPVQTPEGQVCEVGLRCVRITRNPLHHPRLLYNSKLFLLFK